VSLRPAIPILRMYDVSATLGFYLDYLQFSLDWREGEDDGPVFMRVSRDEAALLVSSNHGDGTPGTAVVIPVADVEALHRELHSRSYPFMNPGIEPRGIGREMLVLDPAGNEVRFFQPG
jgi:catechol 2,3-dioxygenase-like lactoylglutathione lyase family enzyme